MEDGGLSPYADPQDLGAWIDMRVARIPLGDGAPNTAIAMFEQLRAGVSAVPAAVGLAAELPPWGQFGCWMIFGALPADPNPVEQLKAAISGE